jgi:hypothetical protein
VFCVCCDVGGGRGGLVVAEMAKMMMTWLDGVRSFQLRWVELRWVSDKFPDV